VGHDPAQRSPQLPILGRTPQEIAESRPRLAAFTAEMLGDLPRKDQRAGDLYAPALLTEVRGINGLQRRCLMTSAKAVVCGSRTLM
jgi:hypothetical protein